MSIPALPPEGSTNWYAHYTALDAAARVVATLESLVSSKADEYHDHNISDLPSGIVVQVTWNGTAWGTRPTSRTDVSVWWVGGPEASRPSGFVDAVDVHWPDLT